MLQKPPNVNVDAVMELADHMSRLREEEYDQREICGSACCIAGWANVLWGYGSGRGRIKSAQRHLGLSDEAAGDLFFACPLAERRPTVADAVGVLRRLAITGVVEWEEGDANNRVGSCEG